MLFRSHRAFTERFTHSGDPDQRLGGSTVQGALRRHPGVGVGVDEGLRIGMLRRAQNGSGLAPFDDDAVAHDQHFVGASPNQTEIVGDQKH